MRVTDEMVNAARSAYSVDRIPNGEIINKIAGPGYGDKLIRGIIESALSHAAGQDGEQCRAASGLSDADIEFMANEMAGCLGEDSGYMEDMLRGLLRALSRGVPEGK